MKHYKTYTPETEPLALAVKNMIAKTTEFLSVDTPSHEQSMAALDAVIGLGFTQPEGL